MALCRRAHMRSGQQLDKARPPCLLRAVEPALWMDFMHVYRTHTCGQLRRADIGADLRLAGWVHRVRDHGGLLFIDLRDHYGLTQIVVDPDSPAFKLAERLRSE